MENERIETKKWHKRVAIVTGGLILLIFWLFATSFLSSGLTYEEFLSRMMRTIPVFFVLMTIPVLLIPTILFLFARIFVKKYGNLELKKVTYAKTLFIVFGVFGILAIVYTIWAISWIARGEGLAAVLFLVTVPVEVVSFLVSSYFYMRSKVPSASGFRIFGQVFFGTLTGGLVIVPLVFFIMEWWLF